MKKVPLHRIAHGRSGDKGDISNCAIIARKPEYYALIAEQVTAERVKKHFGDFCKGPVRRYDLPRIHSFNFVLEQALDGGGTSSLRIDPLGKTYACALLRMEVSVPEDL
jgi:hypothetical protein